MQIKNLNKKCRSIKKQSHLYQLWPKSKEACIGVHRHFLPGHFTPDICYMIFLPPRHFTPDNFTPRHFTPDNFTPRHFNPRHFTPRHFTPRHFTPRHFTPAHKLYIDYRGWSVGGVKCRVCEVSYHTGVKCRRREVSGVECPRMKCHGDEVSRVWSVGWEVSGWSVGTPALVANLSRPPQ